MRAKMDRANRAKQFMPFSALTGLESAMQEKECLRMEEISLAEDAQLELDRKLRSLPIGAEVRALCYSDGQYLPCLGVFRGQEETGLLRIGKMTISPERLLSVELCE